jgi:hypothetical protein
MIQTQWGSGEYMADRGDEMVIAGMRPYQMVDDSNPHLRLHRGITFVLFIDSLVLLFIGSQFGAYSPDGMSSIAIGVLAGLLIAVCLAYRRRSPVAYWPGAAIIGLAGGFFGINALVSLYGFIMGDMSFLLWMFLFTWATFGSARRSISHFHPAYKNAYFGRSENFQQIELEPGEMLAACPHCMAILAIRPDLLSSKDTCPYCSSSLVSEHLASKYEEE